MKAFKKLDLFGSPFTFEMGTGNDKMKTAFGGLLTISILILSLLYFGYLNYMFIAGKVQPKISSQLKKITNNFNLPLKSDLLWFDLRNVDSDQCFMKTQQQLGQQLIQYKAYLQQSDINGEMLSEIHIPVDFCSNITKNEEVDQNAQCLDFSSLSKESAQLQVFPKVRSDSKIYIEIEAVCSTDISTCLSSNIFEKYVFADNVSFNLQMKQEQFNQEQSNLETKVGDIFWDLDSTLITTSKVNLQTSQTTIKNGFLLQSQTKYFHLSDATTSDSYKARSNTSTQNSSTIARFFISLSSTQNIQTVQYAQYPEILAQFASIFNVLLLFGILGAIISKTDIYQFFIDLKLKEYYKQTAFQILREKNQIANQGENSFKENSMEELKITKDKIVKQLKELNEENLNNELTKKYKVSFFERAFRSFVGEQKEDYTKKKMSGKDLYEALFFQASQSQDVFQLQAELMSIKKALALILTPQQYAAIKCCGSSVTDQIPFLLQRNVNDDISNKILPLSVKTTQTQIRQIGSSHILMNEKNYSHIELIDKIDYDEQYFQTQLEGFLQESEKGFTNYDQSAKIINMRLLDCLQKTYGQQ